IELSDEGALAELASGSAGRSMQLIAGDGLALYAHLVEVIADGRVDRPALLRLAARCGGRNGADTFGMVSELLQTLVGRLARTAATGQVPVSASPLEGSLFSTVSRSPAQARLWADAAPQITSTLRQTLAVNLDPAQAIIDIFLELDSTLGKVRHAA
ncbi:MAG: DNA polymerase III subunit delta', partial [Pseudomonadota bacterium]